MSTLKVNNLQVGQDATASNNFTLYQPAVPDGTVRLGVGNSGSVTDVLTFYSDSTIVFKDPSGSIANIGGGTYGAGGNSKISFRTQENSGSLTTRMVIIDDGKIGIANLNPTEGLTVSYNSQPAINIKNSGAYAAYGISNTGTNGRNWGLFATDTNHASFWPGSSEGAFGVFDFTGNTSRLVINSSGNVGIGTGNPNSKLDIFAGDGISITNSGDTFLQCRTTGTTATNYIEFKDSGGAAGAIAYNHTENSLWFKVGGAERLRITSSGTLESYSPDDSTQNFKYRSNDVNWHGYLNQSVEGGTIANIIGCGGAWDANGTTYNCTKDYNGSFPATGLAIQNQYNSAQYGRFSFLFKAGGSTTTDGSVTEWMTIYNGNVGINATGPQEKLEVGGTVRINALSSLGYGYPTKLSPIVFTQYGDYSRPLIALAYKYPGSGNVNLSGFQGSIYCSRGGSSAGLIQSWIHVTVASGYQSQVIGGVGHGSSIFRFVSFTYNGNDYIGVQYNTDAISNIWADGYYYRLHGFKPFMIDSRNSQSGVTNLTAINATQDGRLSSTSSSAI